MTDVQDNHEEEIERKKVFFDFNKKIFSMYKIIEKDFIETIRYVELDEKNFNCFSNEYAIQLLTINSEFDTLMKYIIEHESKNTNKNNLGMNDYKEFLLKAKYYRQAIIKPVLFKNIANSIAITPFKNLGTGGIMLEAENFDINQSAYNGNLKNMSDSVSFEWWKSYNNVKHDRIKNYESASMKNVIDSLAALYVMENLFYKLLYDEAYGGKITRSYIESDLFIQWHPNNSNFNKGIN